MKSCTIAGLGAVLGIYIVIGGAIFKTLEEGNEEDIKESTNNATLSFLSNFSCVPEEDLRAFAATVIKAYQNNVQLFNESNDLSTWELRNSMFFSATVITTIGYGNQTPGTWEGRLFCVFYALIGIPLCLVFLASVGERIYRVNKWLADIINCCSDPTLDMIGDFIVILSLGIAFFLFLPAATFAYVEGWSYGTALYYCVITLSTVGFGDYVAGDGSTEKDQKGWFRFALIFWIMIGMAWFAGCISAIQEYMQKRLQTQEEELEEDTGSSEEDSDKGPANITTQNPQENGAKANGSALQVQCQMFDQSTFL